MFNVKQNLYVFEAKPLLTEVPFSAFLNNSQPLLLLHFQGEEIKDCQSNVFCFLVADGLSVSDELTSVPSSYCQVLFSLGHSPGRTDTGPQLRKPSTEKAWPRRSSTPGGSSWAWTLFLKPRCWLYLSDLCPHVPRKLSQSMVAISNCKHRVCRGPGCPVSYYFEVDCVDSFNQILWQLFIEKKVWLAQRHWKGFWLSNI